MDRDVDQEDLPDLARFTLEDSYDDLRDKKAKRQQGIDNLTSDFLNNDTSVAAINITEENLSRETNFYQQCLLKILKQEPLESFPVPDSDHMHKQAVKGVDEQIEAAKSLNEHLQQTLNKTREENKYLENKINGLKIMEDSYLEAQEHVASSNYEREVKETVTLFRDIKEDLRTVVSKLYPNNEDFDEVLSDLTNAHIKGGDDAYIDVDDVHIDIINFLIAADLVMYHRNDKTKIKLQDLL